ncbi:MAG: hypothetical protein ACOC2M_00790 [bacterium]
MKKKEINLKPFTKSDLKAVTGYKATKLYKELKALETDLIKKFPRYNKNASILPDNQFFWICEELTGKNKDAVLSILKERNFFTTEITLETIKSFYVISGENVFLNQK